MTSSCLAIGAQQSKKKDRRSATRMDKCSSKSSNSMSDDYTRVKAICQASQKGALKVLAALRIDGQKSLFPLDVFNRNADRETGERKSIDGKQQSTAARGGAMNWPCKHSKSLPQFTESRSAIRRDRVQMG
jgi:hypothetical protein